MYNQIHAKGILIYHKDGGVEEIEFSYPLGLMWSCIRCGACCRDTKNRERRVLLLLSDVERIRKATGISIFYEEINEPPFIAIIRKNNGECMFLGEGECSTYDSRAFLCHMYPFWVERTSNTFIINLDQNCPGINNGELLNEEFYNNLLDYALHQMHY